MNELDIVDKYKYLGIVLNYHLDFDITVDVLSCSAGRALGCIINKFRYLGNMGFNTYTKLVNSSVCPIIDYCSAIWGTKRFKAADKVTQRASRFFLGVNRFSALPAVEGDKPCSMESQHFSSLEPIDGITK